MKVTGLAPGANAGVQKVYLPDGRKVTLDDRFVLLADYEALRAAYERLAAPDGAVTP